MKTLKTISPPVAKEVGFAKSKPVVTTVEPVKVTGCKAIPCLVIDSTGITPDISFGFCWSTKHNPTINDKKIKTHKNLPLDKKRFCETLNELEPNTTYYVRSYAINIWGMAYGNEVSFTTGKCK